MTLIISASFGGDVYMGGDSLLGGVAETRDKVISIGPMMVGFVGHAGIQNFVEMSVPNIEKLPYVVNFDHDKVSNYLYNLLSCLDPREDIIGGPTSVVIISSKKFTDITLSKSKEIVSGKIKDLVDGIVFYHGAGWVVAEESLKNSKHIGIEDKILEALEAGAVMLPERVGPPFYIYKNGVKIR